MVQLVLYSQQLVRNNKFALLSDYEWTYTGTWTKEAGLITSPAAGGVLTQLNVLTVGVKYQLQYNIANSLGGGNVAVSDGTTTIHNGSTDGTYTVTFTATDTGLVFNANAGFDASISNVTIVAYPVFYSLDIDSNIPFKFSIEDVFEVGKRKAPRTGSFIIKGTHEVNQAFRQIYLVNGNSIFNPNIKSKCSLISNGINFFNGTLCLDEVIEKLDSNQGVTNIEYNVSIVESVTDIYSILGEKTVRDLSFSEYNHSFDVDVVRRSWLGDIQKNGIADNNTITVNSFNVTSQTSSVVGGLNRVEFTFSTNHNFTVGQEVYVSPDFTQCDISGGANYLFDQVVYSIPAANKIVLECSEPCAAYPAAGTPNVLTVSDRMFAGYGYYYPCVDNGTYIKNVYFAPFGSGLLETGQTYLIKWWDGIDDFTNIGAGANASGEVFTASGTTPNIWLGSLVVKLRDTSLAIGTDPLNSKFGDATALITQATDASWEIYDFVPYLYVREILIKTFALCDVDYDCDVFDTKIFRRLIIPMSDPYNIIEGATVQMDEWTPSIKLKDILNSVLNMFNLSMTQSGKTLVFKNRGEYFDNAAIDWSDKVDISQPLKLTMLNKDGAKIYHFKYSDSKDFLNTLYLQQYGGINNTNGLINIKDRNSGDYIIDRESDYLSDTKEIGVLFEPSILAGGNYSAFQDRGVYSESTALFPMHISGDAARITVNRTYTPKILIAGARWNYIEPSNATPMNLYFVSQSTPSLNLITSWYYGFAAHFDNPFQVTPTHDLNFTLPLGIYFNDYYSCVPVFNVTTDLNDTDWPTNSLYLKYWYRYISQITNRNTKKVSGRFKLSLSDIYNLDFSKPVIVGGMKLKLISVDNWFLNTDGLCDVEFLITK